MAELRCPEREQVVTGVDFAGWRGRLSRSECGNFTGDDTHCELRAEATAWVEAACLGRAGCTLALENSSGLLPDRCRTGEQRWLTVQVTCGATKGELGNYHDNHHDDDDDDDANGSDDGGHADGDHRPVAVEAPPWRGRRAFSNHRSHHPVTPALLRRIDEPLFASVEAMARRYGYSWRSDNHTKCNIVETKAAKA